MSSEIRDKPNFFDSPFVFSMGPQRAGTSWLDRYLRSRDDVGLPKDVKETFYFDRLHDRGIEFYASHFDPQPQHDYQCEISTTSFDDPEAPARLHASFGADIQLLCPLRDPVKRSYSLYLHYKRYGVVNGSLREACFKMPQIINSSRYAKHVQSWLQFFDKEQILFLFQEDLEQDQKEYVCKVSDFLNLPYMPPGPEINGRYNATTHSPSNIVAGAAQQCAQWMRDRQMHKIINRAKSLGLKKIVFGNDNAEAASVEMDESDRMWLEDVLVGQREALEALIGPIPQWSK